MSANFTIDCDFPGGNIIVDDITENHVRLRQDLRDTEGHWFYWRFRVCGAQGRTLVFQFTNGSVMGSRGPAFSTDQGQTWTWLGADSTEETGEGQTFRYRFGDSEEAVQFSCAIPYLEENLRQFLERTNSTDKLRLSEFCRTNQGRSVEKLALECTEQTPAYQVFFTARHHACESMANYVLEGIMEQTLADDEHGRWLRQHVEMAAVPFVDKDGVENGDQGKNRKPHDHARDYRGKSIYPTVQAVKEFLPAWSGKGRYTIVFDLHCPGLRGRFHETILFPDRPRDSSNWSKLRPYLQVLEQNQAGPLTFYLDDSEAFEGWDSGKLDDIAPWTLAKWSREMVEDVRFSGTLEIPYANASGAVVTAEAARSFGRDMAAAMAIFLKSQA